MIKCESVAFFSRKCLRGLGPPTGAQLAPRLLIDDITGRGRVTHHTAHVSNDKSKGHPFQLVRLTLIYSEHKISWCEGRPELCVMKE